MFKRVALLSVLLSVSSLSYAALRVDGTVVQPYPHELIGATVESRFQIARESNPATQLAFGSATYVVAEGEVSSAAWGPSTDTARANAVKVPTGVVERLLPDGTTAREVVLTNATTQEGLSFSTRFAATQHRFVGEVRGQLNYSAGMEKLTFQGKDYQLPVVRQVHFEQPVVLGLNQFTVDGMIVEIDIAAKVDTLGGRQP